MAGKTSKKGKEPRIDKPVTHAAQGAVVSGGMTDVVSFEASGQQFALPASCVAEVRPLNGCTPVPGAPQGLSGIVNFRGHMLPVFNVGRMLGGRHKVSDHLHLVVCGAGTPEFGLVSEDLPRFGRLAHGLIDDGSPEPCPDWLCGMADGMMVINGEAFMSNRIFFLV